MVELTLMINAINAWNRFSRLPRGASDEDEERRSRLTA